MPARTLTHALSVTWARVTTVDNVDDVQTALLFIAPDVGVVRHEAFDGTILELQ